MVVAFGDPGLPEAFWKRLHVQDDGCWAYRGSVDKRGYGYFRGKPVHRLVAALAYTIPDGYVVDHTCHQKNVCVLGNKCPHRRCCNPDHLEPVTNEMNIERGNWENHTGLPPRKVCRNGHDKPIGKSCPTCIRNRRLEINKEREAQLAAFRERRHAVHIRMGG